MASFFNKILTALDFTTGKLCLVAAVTGLLYMIVLSEKKYAHGYTTQAQSTFIH